MNIDEIKDKRIAVLLSGGVDSSVVEVEGTLENIIAAREALAAQAAAIHTLAGQQVFPEPAAADTRIL